jgi:hypothetical protein
MKIIYILLILLLFTGCSLTNQANRKLWEDYRNLEIVERFDNINIDELI